MKTVKPYGDEALIISFEREISITVNKKVLALWENLKEHSGFTFFIPAYNSLTIGINKEYWDLMSALQFTLNTDESLLVESNPQRTVTIPACYEPRFGMDIVSLSKSLDLSPQNIIDLHSSITYHVYMLGFIAGFPYMGNTDKKIHCSRLPEPRLSVPGGSIGLAGAQTGIYPTAAPGGWQIIAQTPLIIFNYKEENNRVLQPGDKVKFRPISEDEFRIIELKIETEIYSLEISYD